MYLESVVRVDTAPAALLQLHLRVKIFLVLLHYVRQVRTPAALCMILLAVAVVVVVVLTINSLGKDYALWLYSHISVTKEIKHGSNTVETQNITTTQIFLQLPVVTYLNKWLDDLKSKCGVWLLWV